MTGMAPERLDAIRANLPTPDADLSRRERDAHDLLDEVKRLRAELEICERASLRNAQAHMAAHTEVKRLWAGIEALTHHPFTDERGQVYDFRNSAIARRLLALLNPTGGEDRE